LSVLFGPKFVAAATPFSILVWTFPLTLISGHARWILIAAKRGNDMLVAQVAGVAMAIPAAWLLIGPFGSAGAAMAMVLACAMVWLVSQYYAHLRGHDVPVLPVLVPAITAGLIITAAKMMNIDPLQAGVGGVALYAIAMILFDREILHDMKKLAPARHSKDTIPTKAMSPDAAMLADGAAAGE
jgi:O-antigen/teichoic acid export membrane protein